MPTTSSSIIYPLRYAPAWLAGGYVVVAVIVLGSLLPGMPGPDFAGSDKLVHLGMYFALMLWFAGIYLPRNHLWLMLSLAALGITLELVQEFSGLRNGDWRDVAANVTGIALGMLLAKRGMSGWCEKVETRWLRSRSR